MSLPTAEARVCDLRQRDAADEAWQWIVDLKDQAKSNHKAAESQLNAIFKLGTMPTGLDGSTDGILVMTTTNRVLDAAARLVTGLWMPWQGKRFNAVASTGDNRMTASSRVPAKLLWPRYPMKDAADGKLAFDFKTYADTGKADPDVQVMVIDYADVEDNPRLIIRSIRDELVEVVPGAYLGKILFRLPRNRYQMLGFFALCA
ncbi:hypothetical protein [Mycobacterium lacus]|uniref:Uncharacterized protein n=1 Tax=Mycobacterium lacus TaxID=169765 RepID=A0A1X1XTG8_9MYCO|nr:hypothetical protein [Mycobacterium lacus]MCV7124556.1 hypothetical protein [Mycobacterium lacus]ORW02060.1 hypothetical protein AWC15_07070 [Mycobacterium lacus]BBX99433.1 hypothetical protein MLAC_47270 [Mycobacterium lacus]